jgi:hypothetical protein
MDNGQAGSVAFRIKQDIGRTNEMETFFVASIVSKKNITGLKIASCRASGQVIV